MVLYLSNWTNIGFSFLFLTVNLFRHSTLNEHRLYPVYLKKNLSVIFSIPTYFENKESPIMCYKYNKPSRSTVSNYNRLVTVLDIENSIPDS